MSNKKSTKQQIKDLTSKLESITQELHSFRIQVQHEQEETRNLRRERSQQQRRRSTQIGGLVEITNNYQNLQGTRGRVIRLSTSFVTIGTPEGCEITRGSQNVRIVEEM